MISENVTQEFCQIVCFITLPPPPQVLFLGYVLFCSCLFSFLPIRGIVRLNSPGVQTSPTSDTPLAESTGSAAGIVRVKLKNNKSCQCTFPSRGAWHQWALKKTAVALVFPFLQQSIHGSPPLSSVFVRTRGWPSVLPVLRQGR